MTPPKEEPSGIVHSFRKECHCGAHYWTHEERGTCKCFHCGATYTKIKGQWKADNPVSEEQEETQDEKPTP